MRRTRHALSTAAVIAAIMLAGLAGLAGCATAQATFADEQREPQEFNFVHDWSEPREPNGMARIMAEQKARQKQQEAAQAEIGAEAGYEPDYAEGEAYGCSYDPELNNNPAYSGAYAGNDYGNPFKGQGVASDGAHDYGWYSQNVLPGDGLEELNANGRHVDESTGYVVDGDGYIAVAIDGVERGTVIGTPWGEAKVYDRVVGEDAEYTGFVDIYTDF